VDASHPDLRRRVAGAWKVIPRGKEQNVVRCPSGRNNDAFGHGTGVAGIIAAIAPNARIFDIRVLRGDCSGTAAALLAGFGLAVERGFRLINLSLACQANFAPQLHQLCEQAYRQNLVVVAAKRNMPLEDNGWPAELSSCLSVDRADFPSPYMLRFLKRPPIEFAARGHQVMTAARGGGYSEMTGTSFAAPTLTGLCALLLGAFPDLRPFEIKTLLKHAAGR
ncbi:MAG: S8 family serine peptidase, partial [Planctomycetota bacterium]|nr:S8 family serine peptidase [Planctomycetota bacterium]